MIREQKILEGSLWCDAGSLVIRLDNSPRYNYKILVPIKRQKAHSQPSREPFECPQRSYFLD